LTFDNTSVQFALCRPVPVDDISAGSWRRCATDEKATKDNQKALRTIRTQRGGPER